MANHIALIGYGKEFAEVCNEGEEEYNGYHDTEPMHAPWEEELRAKK